MRWTGQGRDACHVVEREGREKIRSGHRSPQGDPGACDGQDRDVTHVTSYQERVGRGGGVGEGRWKRIYRLEGTRPLRPRGPKGPAGGD